MWGIYTAECKLISLLHKIRVQTQISNCHDCVKAVWCTVQHYAISYVLGVIQTTTPATVVSETTASTQGTTVTHSTATIPSTTAGSTVKETSAAQTSSTAGTTTAGTTATQGSTTTGASYRSHVLTCGVSI